MKLILRHSAFERLVKAIVWVSGRVLDTDCWEWPKSVCNKGYGCICIGGRMRRSHIVMWEMASGRRVRPGYTLDHLCRNKRCFRPIHMEEVTRAVNTARGNYDNPRSTEHLRKK